MALVRPPPQYISYNEITKIFGNHLCNEKQYQLFLKPPQRINLPKWKKIWLLIT